MYFEDSEVRTNNMRDNGRRWKNCHTKSGLLIPQRDPIPASNTDTQPVRTAGSDLLSNIFFSNSSALLEVNMFTMYDNSHSEVCFLYDIPAYDFSGKQVQSISSQEYR